MVLPTPDPLPLIPATIPPPEAITPPSAEATETADQRTAMPDPAAASRLGVAGWIVNDLGNTLFSQNMIANYFPVWVVAVMGAGDGAISLVNTVTMALMLGIGPWLGAVSDRLPRRLPILIVTTTGSCLLTFFIGNDLRGSLIFFLGANLLFQAGLVIYDSLLPAVSTAENRGRVGGAAVGLGYLGSLLGLGIGFVVMNRGGDYQTIFRLTAAGFFLLSLPCFLWVKETPRIVARVAPRALARAAFADVAATARRARDYPDLVRFLVGRAFYAEAANTIGLFMAVYLTVQLGFSTGEKDRLLLVAILAAVGGGFFWGRVVDRIGPRDSLLRVLVVWSIALALIAATGFTILPNAALWVIAPLAGFALGGTWASDRPLMIGLAPPEYLGQFYGLYALAGRFAALVGPIIWWLVVDGLGLGRPAALLVLLGLVIIAMVILRPLPSSIGRAPLPADT
ncbi:MAG: MFS transporter [Chloroflexia bacterium]|nr:MFS transporter [Chloroflexia bacterium]